MGKSCWIGIGLLGIFIGIAGTVLYSRIEQPPVQEMSVLRSSLSEAERLRARIYCPGLYQEACMLYDSAMIVWKQENERWIVLRKFTGTKQLSEQAAVKVSQAIKRAKAVGRDVKARSRLEINCLRKEVKAFESVFTTLPVGRMAKNDHAHGKLLLNAAEVAYEKGEYTEGLDKCTKAGLLIHKAYRVANVLLEKYFENLPLWQDRLKKAIADSEKKGKCVIVVEKFPPCCKIYENGIEKCSFKAEFGRNWIGDKQCEGDYATPEGQYHIVKKLQKSATQYYKALLLDYPNAEDRLEFERLKKKGELSRSAKIGGLIEIHGEGGRGAHWTNGCIALENKNMDIIYRKAGKGMSVVIIGASVTLKEALKNYAYDGKENQ